MFKNNEAELGICYVHNILRGGDERMCGLRYR
jgi:hypothetical protein